MCRGALGVSRAEGADGRTPREGFLLWSLRLGGSGGKQTLPWRHQTPRGGETPHRGQESGARARRSPEARRGKWVRASGSGDRWAVLGRRDPDP